VVTGCDFVLVYRDLWGQHIDFGNRMTRPVSRSIMFNRWEETHFAITNLLYTTEIVALWTEYDYCDCGDFIVNLDNQDSDRPLCDLCAREGYESARGELLRDDGGI
jgi:hypothetical protein